MLTNTIVQEILIEITDNEESSISIIEMYIKR